MDLGQIDAFDARSIEAAPREAAVVVPVLADRRALVFIRRADHLEEHAGEMSFPGGGREPTDADLEATALREAREEIGLDPGTATVLGRLDDIRTVTDYVIRPVVARVPDRPYVPTDREVAAVEVLGIDALTDPTNYERETREHPEYGSIDLHFFRVDGVTVWGATARILVSFLELVTEWRVPP